MRTRSLCSLCGKPARAKNLCAMHYARLLRTGEPETARVTRPTKNRKCSFCDEPHYAKDYCYLHYVRNHRHGDPRIRRTRSGETFTDGGYRRIYVDGCSVLEHRHLIEQKLGRTLEPDEIVHHRNRNTSDNTLENLELMKRGAHSSLHHEQGDFPYRPCTYDQRPCLICGETPTKARSLCSRHHEAWRSGRKSVPADLIVPDDLRLITRSGIQE